MNRFSSGLIPAYLFFFLTSIYSQDRLDIPFLVPGHQWIYAYNTYDILPDPLVSQTFETITIGEDTLINGLAYSKLRATLPAPCGIFNTTEYLREDGSKIFRLSDDHSQEFLMIDFEETSGYQLMYENLNGEVETGNAIIDSFGIEYTYDGFPVDVQYMRIQNNQSFGDDDQYKVYRDIGFVQYGLLFPDVGSGLCDIMEGMRLRCFFNGTDTLHFTEFDCYESELINATNESHISNIHLSPNPATDQINIPPGFIFKDMINLQGRKLYPLHFETFIDLTGLPPGYYVLRFISRDRNRMYVGRLIKY